MEYFENVTLQEYKEYVLQKTQLCFKTNIYADIMIYHSRYGRAVHVIFKEKVLQDRNAVFVAQEKSFPLILKNSADAINLSRLRHNG